MRYFIACWALLLLGITLVFGQVPMTGAGTGAPAVASGGGGGYTGPIDINGTAFVFWSMRPGSAALASAGQKLFRVCDTATGSTCGDVTATAAGGVTFPGSPSCGSCEVATLYDQSGSLNCSGSVACDLTASHGSRPTVTVSCQNALPCLVFGGSGSSCMGAFAGSNTQSQPLSLASVLNTTNGSSQQVIWEANTGFFWETSGANTINFNGSFSATATDGSPNSDQALGSGASSKITVNGSSTTGTDNSSSGSGFTLGGFGVCASLFWTGKFFEHGMWAGDKSTNFSTMSSNQRTYWSF